MDQSVTYTNVQSVLKTISTTNRISRISDTTSNLSQLRAFIEHRHGPLLPYHEDLIS